MKKNLVKPAAILLAGIFMFASCNNEEKVTMDLATQSISKNLCDLKDLSKQIEELDSRYPSIETKGPVSTTIAVVGADMMGWKAGGWIGVKAGFCFGGFGGMIPGGLIGGGVGAAFFSAAIFFDWNQATPPNIKDTSLFLADENGNYGEFEDLGILHNRIMLDIQNNKASYFNKNGVMDSLKLYNRIIEIFNANGYRTDTLDINHPKAMIACSQKYCVKLKKEGIELTDIKQTFSNFATDLQLDEEKKAILNLNLNYLIKLNSMSEANLQNYSKEYYNTVLNSDIKPVLREDILRSNSIITNSTLCWKRN